MDGRNIILITHMAFGCSLVGCLITASSTLVVLVTRPKTKYLEPPKKMEGGKKTHVPFLPYHIFQTDFVQLRID